MKRIILLFFSLFFVSHPIYSQYSSKLVQESLSLQEMEAGIVLFNERRYAASIQAFEQSIAYEPLNYAARYRLGLAYLYAGYTQNAINTWEALVSAGVADNQVIVKLNELYNQLAVDKGYTPPPSYVFTGYYDGFTDASHQMKRASFVAYDKVTDRKFIASSGTGIIIELDALNTIKQKYGSRFLWTSLLKMPTGIAVTSNYVYVADFSLDKIFVFNRNLTGSLKNSFGKRGSKTGELSGVMGITFGEEGYLYVVNGGNARIDRFTADGAYVNSFGEGRLFRPTDIIVTNGLVYVSDITKSKQGHIQVFNTDGLFIQSIGREFLREPRGLFLDEDILYISDTKTGLQLYNLTQNTANAFISGDDRLSMPFDMIKDKDGFILRSDFNSQVLGLYASAPLLYANLNLDLVQINTESYPYIYALLRVRDRTGNPLPGLTETELSVKEFNTPISRPLISGTENYRSKMLLDFVVDSSIASIPHRAQLEYFFKNIVSNMSNDDRLQISLADNEPYRLPAANANILKTWNFITNHSPKSTEAQNLDALIYDNITSLFNNLRNRAVIVFTEGSGVLNSSYGFDVLASYAERNSIPIYVINFGGKNENQWRRLAESTYGVYYNAKKDATKIMGLYQTIKDSPPLEYLLEYETVPLPKNKIWVDLFIDINRSGISGRVINGYYRPINAKKQVNLEESFFGTNK